LSKNKDNFSLQKDLSLIIALVVNMKNLVLVEFHNAGFNSSNKNMERVNLLFVQIYRI